MTPTEQDKMSNQSEQGEIILETKQLAEVSLYMFEQYRKEFTPLANQCISELGIQL